MEGEATKADATGDVANKISSAPPQHKHHHIRKYHQRQPTTWTKIRHQEAGPTDIPATTPLGLG